MGAASEIDFIAITHALRGDDVDAACGQLAGQVQDKTRRTVHLRRVTEERS